MIDYLIFYEVGVREFESIALLGYELKRRGYSVEYIGFDQTNINAYIKNRKLIKRYYNNVRVAVMPSLYNDSEIYNTVYYVCGRCTQIVDLRWEQYFSKGEMADLKSVLFPVESSKFTYHLCWGEKSQASLSLRGINKRYIPITGPLQMDFVRTEFRGLYEDKTSLFQEYELDSNRQTVLYISSFTSATMTDRDKASVQKAFDGQYNFKEKEYLFHRKSYELTIDWIEKFLEEHIDIQFIYRPHPAENITDYITKLNKYENFHIIMDKSVKQWIVVCDIITTWVSTSIAEAHFAGKNCFVIRPLPYPENADICYYSEVKAIDCLDDFLAIQNIDMEESIPATVFDEHYSCLEEKASYLRTADELEKIINSTDVFVWNDAKMRTIDKRRKMLFVRNIVFWNYLLMLKIGLTISKKINIRFPEAFQVRIDGIANIENNNKYKSEQNLVLEIERISKYMDTVKYNVK